MQVIYCATCHATLANALLTKVVLRNFPRSVSKVFSPYTLHTTHYTLHPTHYTLHTTPYTLHAAHHSSSLTSLLTSDDTREAHSFLESDQY